MENLYQSDNLSMYYLSQHRKRRHENRKMRVAFVVSNITSWEKQKPVYEELISRDTAEAFIILSPHYRMPDYMEQKVAGEYYLPTWNHFHQRYNNVIDWANLMDWRVLKPDYIFYDTPYEHLRPSTGFGSNEAVKHAKVCYIPYASNEHKTTLEWQFGYQVFFRNVSFCFCALQEMKSGFEKIFPYGVALGYQHFKTLGYPIWERYLHMKARKNGQKSKILWAPRWTYHPSVGGSHFFEYKDDFISLKKKFTGRVQLSIRPHPLMMQTFIQEGRMTQADETIFLKQLKAQDIVWDNAMQELESVVNDTDILIADISSINIMFLLAGCPVIYCDAGMELTSYGKELLEAMYVAHDWSEVEHYLSDLLSGKDPLLEQRIQLIERYRDANEGASKRIVDCLQQDFQDSLLCEAERLG